MGAWVDAILEAVGRYDEWAYAFVFLIGVVDTLLIIGYFVPGTALMIGTGVLVGHGELAPEWAGAALVGGGIAGDLFGYWLGRRYRDRILGWRFFAKRRRLIERIERMTERHGGKAVLSARFIGQIRPLVPFVAGVVNMPSAKFMVYNVTSAAVSAAVHLLIGMAVGLGLSATGAVTGRLAILIVLAALAGYAAYSFAVWLWNRATLDAPAIIERWLERAHATPPGAGRRRRLGAFLVLHLFDPHYRAAAEVAGLGLIALLSLAGIVLVIGDMAEVNPLADANRAVFLFFDGLRNPWADRVLAVLVGLASPWLMLALGLAVAALLAVQRAWRAAGHWLLALALAFLSAEFILWLADDSVFRLESGLGLRHALPSGQAVALVVMVGYLALLSSQRVAAFATAFSFVSLVHLAQIYFGVLYVSGLVTSLLLGIVWLAVLVASTRDYLIRAHHPWSDIIGAVAAIGFVVAAILYSTALHRQELTGLPRPGIETRLLEAEWREEGWRRLATYRIDLVGEPEEPINVQLAGEGAAVQKALMAAGWRAPESWDLVSVLRLLSGLGLSRGEGGPVLPRLWNGRPEGLRLVADAGEGERLILRLWDHHYRLEDGTPLWLGTVEREGFRAPVLYGLITLPPIPEGYMAAQERLGEDLAISLRVRGPGWRPARADGRPLPWNGATVIGRLP